jgi:hypothetical protein
VKRHRKKVLVGLVLLGLLGLSWRLSVRAVPRPPPIRLTFVSFTNGLVGEHMALFNLSNSAHRPILFATGVLVQTDGSGPPVFFPPDGRAYMGWAGNPPEAFPSTLAAGRATTFATKLPEPGSVWIEHVIWQLKPNKMEDVYAAALDNVLEFFHRVSYPPGLRPSARIWHEILITSDMLHERDAEPGAAPNGDHAASVGSSVVVEGRHR